MEQEFDESRRKLSGALYDQREAGMYHQAYQKELAFYEAVQRGDPGVLGFSGAADDGQLGRLSSSPLRNQKYHLIIMTAMISRFCLRGGMPLETAFTLSDLYIRRIDLLGDEESLAAVRDEIVRDFSRRMRELRETHLYSKYTSRAVAFMHAHLHGRITLQQLAGYCGCNKTYLCALFKRETGLTAAKYIERLKVEAAEEMLLYSGRSSMDIGGTLGFSSHSHFISVFRKHTGMTPAKYRRTHWSTVLVPTAPEEGT